MSTREEYRAACLRAEEAKAALDIAIGDARARLTPAALKDSAKRRIKSGATATSAAATRTVKRHPIAAASLLSALLLWLFRKPAWALSRTLYVKGRDTYHARSSRTPPELTAPELEAKEDSDEQ